jgi:hypothetical protein
LAQGFAVTFDHMQRRPRHGSISLRKAHPFRALQGQDSLRVR